MTAGSAPGLRVCGLDPSLTSFGAAVTRGPDASPDLYRFKTKLVGHERLAYLLGEVRDVARGCDLAVVEGVLAKMPGAEAHLNLAGLHWLVRHCLWELGVPYAVVTPATRMKWLTGKGRVEKDECLVAAMKRFPLADLQGNDQADALTLAAMGAAAFGCPVAAMPADRAALLRATKLVKRPGGAVPVPVIAWPNLAARAAV